MSPLLHTVDAPEPGIPATGLLRSAIVVTHASNAALAAEVDPGTGAGSDNAAAAAPDMRWANGLEFQPYSCADAVVLDPCAATNAGMAEDANRPAVRPYHPFAVDAYDRCSTFGWLLNDYESRARRLMAGRESKAVEHEFWTGTLNATNPHLADGANAAGFGAPVGVGTGLSPRAGLAALCQAIHDENGGVGMIHCRGRLLQYWMSIGALRFENGEWYTATGAKVVGGAGYPGTGPTGQAISGTTEWAFATDLVTVHRGPVDVFAASLTAQSIAHQTNNEVVRAQRLYAPIWNGCALAAASITTPATDE